MWLRADRGVAWALSHQVPVAEDCSFCFRCPPILTTPHTLLLVVVVVVVLVVPTDESDVLLRRWGTEGE